MAKYYFQVSKLRFTIMNVDANTSPLGCFVFTQNIFIRQSLNKV